MRWSPPVGYKRGRSVTKTNAEGVLPDWEDEGWAMKRAVHVQAICDEG